jgi:hypothetical protein
MREIKKGYRRVQFILKGECVKELKRMALEEGETLQSLIETAILQAYFEDDRPEDEDDRPEYEEDPDFLMEEDEAEALEESLEREYREIEREYREIERECRELERE